ncbi:amino acid transporter heavy chain SLC3A2 [Danio rerio]|uniref:4F2 cell-surface antigen heavy chain n=1 Tax=Danio rerio TaxID=7955 RepID=X1WDW3_DANRE|nr:4F2 cell-surface antigen heavy chain-like [Danio rerio]|eukprot:XP_001343266.1 4F2 cell-surface antigen heavy chain-like [Danio rerio]
MTLKVEGDPAYGSVSGARFTDVEGSESVPLLTPGPPPPPPARRRAWKPLSREELERCAGGPQWRKFRRRLVLCFWICWMLLLGAAVLIVIRSPRATSPVLHWWQRDLIYRLQPMLFLDADRQQDSRINRVCERLPYLKSVGAGAVILEGLFGNSSSSTNLTEIDQNLGTLPQLTQLITESRKAGVRVILDLCELDLFEQESNNDTAVWSGASESIQYSLRYWLDHGVSGFGICDTDAAFSAKTLMEWNKLMQEFSSQDDERILMVRQTGNTLPVLNVSSFAGSLVELVTKSLIPPSHHPLSTAEVAEAIEVSLQMPQRDWPSWTVGGGVPRELNRAILLLIMTLPGTPIIKYGDELSSAQGWNRLNQPLALFQSLSQSRAREEALHFGRFTFLSFNTSLPSSSGLNTTDTPLLAYLRSWGCVHFLVLFNLGSAPHTMDPDWAPSLPEGGVFVTSTGLDRFGPVSLNTIKMQPHEAIVIKLFESDSSS